VALNPSLKEPFCQRIHTVFRRVQELRAFPSQECKTAFFHSLKNFLEHMTISPKAIQGCNGLDGEHARQLADE
jgi:hypothetical protein